MSHYPERVRKTLINGCINKAVFRNEREAEKHCAQMKRDRQINLYQYRCPECGKYHVTSTKQ